MLQDALMPQELVQETILLQEVLLTAHMARAYEFPTLVRLMCALNLSLHTMCLNTLQLNLCHRGFQRFQKCLL